MYTGLFKVDYMEINLLKNLYSTYDELRSNLLNYLRIIHIKICNFTGLFCFVLQNFPVFLKCGKHVKLQKKTTNENVGNKITGTCYFSKCYFFVFFYCVSSSVSITTFFSLSV